MKKPYAVTIPFSELEYRYLERVRREIAPTVLFYEWCRVIVLTAAQEAERQMPEGLLPPEQGA